MPIETTQELIDLLNAVEDKTLKPLVLCGIDNEYVSLDKIQVEEEIGENGETRLVIWEAN